MSDEEMIGITVVRDYQSAAIKLPVNDHPAVHVNLLAGAAGVDVVGVTEYKVADTGQTFYPGETLEDLAALGLIQPGDEVHLLPHRHP